jgi:MFS transporter, DHA1 family, multidrug resistance protein
MQICIAAMRRLPHEFAGPKPVPAAMTWMAAPAPATVAAPPAASFGPMSTPRLSGGLILILGALTAFAPLSIDMYLPGLPTLERAFGATAASVQLTVSAFLVGIAIGQALYGPLSDRFGRKPPLYAGVALYVAASVACAQAPSVEAMIGLRFLQAFGGCAGIVIARAIVRDLVEGADAARAFSTLILVMGVAPILAPLLGGYVLQWLGWQAIFWALALFGLACLVAVATRVPETRPQERRTTGGVVSAIVVYARLIGDRSFIGYALTSGLALAGMFVYITTSPHLFIDVFGLSTQAYGWMFGTNAAGFIAVSQLNRLLLNRFSMYRVLAWAVRLNLAAALVLLLVAVTGFDGLWAVLVPLFLAIASLGILMPNAVAAALAGQAVHAGSASALIGTIQFVLGATSGAVAAALHSNSALAMAVAIAGSSAVAFVTHARLTPR